MPEFKTPEELKTLHTETPTYAVSYRDAPGFCQLWAEFPTNARVNTLDTLKAMVDQHGFKTVMKCLWEATRESNDLTDKEKMFLSLLVP